MKQNYDRQSKRSKHVGGSSTMSEGSSSRQTTSPRRSVHPFFWSGVLRVCECHHWKRKVLVEVKLLTACCLRCKRHGTEPVTTKLRKPWTATCSFSNNSGINRKTCKLPFQKTKIWRFVSFRSGRSLNINDDQRLQGDCGTQQKTSRFENKPNAGSCFRY